MIKIIGNRYGGIHSVQIISKSAGVNSKISMPVIFKQTVLHLPAVAVTGISSRTNKQIKVSIMIGIKK